MSKTPLTDTIREIAVIVDQQEVDWMTMTFWKTFALQLADEHKEEARKLVTDFCAEIESRWEQIKAAGREAVFMDALSAFKAEASENNLR